MAHEGTLREVSGTADPVAGFVAIDLGGPASGWTWDVRSVLLVDSAAPYTAIAATTPFVASAASVQAINPSRLRDVDAGAGTPFAEFYGLTIVILNPNHLIIGADGATAANYVAAAQVLERPASAFTR